MDIVLLLQLLVAVVIALFVAYNLLHYVLFLLVTQPRDASKIGHQLNQFEQRQLVEWTPQPNDFLKHDDQKRTYDDVFGTYRDEQANYSTCVFPRAAFSCMVVRWIPVIGFMAAVTTVTSPTAVSTVDTRILPFTIGSST